MADADGDEPIVYLEWIDASGDDGWIKRGDVLQTAAISRVRVVGFVLHEDDDGITLVQAVDDEHGNIHSALTIPKLAIVDRRELVT